MELVINTFGSFLHVKDGLFHVASKEKKLEITPENIDETKLKAITAESEENIDRTEDSVYIFPFSQENFSKIRLLGVAFDKALVNDELKEFFI